MKLVSIVGARPRFINCAPLYRELWKEHEEVQAHKGQHYEDGMLDIFFEELDLEKGKYIVITVHRPGNTDIRARQV